MLGTWPKAHNRARMLERTKGDCYPRQQPEGATLGNNRRGACDVVDMSKLVHRLLHSINISTLPQWSLMLKE
jgi:hypothetical protein